MRKPTNVIQVYVSDEDKKLIEKKAAASGLSTSKFCLNQILNENNQREAWQEMYIKSLTLDNEIGLLRKEINNVVFTALKTREIYYPDIMLIHKNMERVEDIMNNIFKNIGLAQRKLDNTLRAMKRGR